MLLHQLFPIYDFKAFPEFENMICQAVKVNKFEKSLVDTEYQAKLINIFEGLIEKNNTIDRRKISTEHFNSIMNKLNYSSKSNNEKAHLLLILATIFVKLSSSTMFGTEFDSPQIIRIYGAALINKALELNPKIIENQTKKEWLGRIFGKRNYFTCTSILSNMMKDKLLELEKQSQNAKLMKQFFPITW